MEIWKNLSIENLPGEIWKDIAGFESFYQISNLGRVKSISNGYYQRRGNTTCFVSMKTKIVAQSKKGVGYLGVGLSIDGMTTQCYVHRLVLESFDCSREGMQVNHMDGCKTNNCLENLEWCTDAENKIHAISNGLRKYNFGEKHHSSKISNEVVLKIIQMLSNTALPIKAIAVKFNITPNTVTRINNGYIYAKLTGFKGKAFR